MRIGAVALYLILALAPTLARALDPVLAPTQYELDSWNTDRGLPQNSVLGFAQTPDGYVWLATQEGLARFDGVRFVTFDTRSTPALPHNWILTLLPARDRGLWIGTAGGLARLRDGSVESWHAKDGLPNEAVTGIVEDDDGTLWLTTFGGGLARMRGGKIETIIDAATAGDGRLRMVVRGPDGALWITANTAGLMRFDGAHVEHFGREQGLDAPAANRLLFDADGTLWVSTTQGLFARRGERFERVLPDEKALAAQVRVLARDRAGNLYAGSDAGLLRIRDKHVARLTRADGLADDQVRSLFEDRDGDLWVGTFSGGASRLHDPRFLALGAREGLPVDDVWSVLEARDGALWIGTQGGGLVRRGADGALERIGEAQGLLSKRVTALAEDAAGALWIGTQEFGVARLANGRVEQFRQAQGLAGDSVSALAVDADGAVWVAGSGLSRIRDGRVERFGAEQGLPEGVLDALLVARDGTLWIGSEIAGLVHRRDARFEVFGKDAGLKSLHVMALHESDDGAIWLGTNGGGLHRFLDGHARALGAAQGLFDDLAYVVIEDERHALWMSCNRGLYRVARADAEAVMRGDAARVTSTVYDRRDGLRTSEFNGGAQPSGLRTRDGTLWFASIKGAVGVEPARLASTDAAPAVIVEQVVVDGIERALEDRSPLSALRRNLDIAYTAPSFRHPERVRFRYQLEGYDAGWVDAGTRRVAYYTALPPGDYVFRVGASDERGAFTGPVASWSFTQKPRIYQTAWFYALVAAGILGMIALWMRLHARRAARREVALARLVDERTEELALANRELDRLSRLDGLTGLANRRELDRRLTEEWRRAQRESFAVALILVDIDAFKLYNDRYGHLAGDDCLIRVAHAVAGCIQRPADLAARYGGEEIVALLPNTTIEGAAALAEQIRARVASEGIPHEGVGEAATVTISVGVACVAPVPGVPGTSLIAAADAALYRAKRGGKNRVETA